MRIHDNFQIPVIQIADRPSDGIIGSAASTIDISSGIAINQTTSGRNLSLTIPTDSMDGMKVTVINIGTVSFQMFFCNIQPNSSKDFIYSNGSWKIEADNTIGWRDVRSTNLNPQDYNGGLFWEFKQSASIGLAPTLPNVSTYVGLLTMRSYSTGADLSGGTVRQEATSDTGIKYFRLSTSGTAWSVWRETVRITAPPTPVLTVATGAVTIGSQNLQNVVTDISSVSYQMQINVNQLVRTGAWDALTIPLIAGFQQPITQVNSVYRSGGSPAGYPPAPCFNMECGMYNVQTLYIAGVVENVACQRTINITIRYVKN